MIETIILEFLSKNIDEPVYLEEPIKDKDGNPKKYIVFEKTSSGSVNQLNSATIAFKSYGISLYDAALLNNKLKAALAKLVELDSISRVKLNSDYNFTDTETKRHRYQAVFDIKYY